MTQREQFTGEEVWSIRRALSWLRRSIIIAPTLIRIQQSQALAAKVYRSSTQSIPTGTGADLSWDTEVYDTDDLWDAADPTKFTVRHAGAYMVGGSWAMAAGDVTAAARHAATVIVNNSIISAAGELHTVVGQVAVANVATCVLLEAGDFVEINAYHNIGVDRNAMAAGSGLYYRNFGYITRMA